MLANYADFICQRFGKYSSMKFHTLADISLHGRVRRGGLWPQPGASSMACLI